MNETSTTRAGVFPAPLADTGQREISSTMHQDPLNELKRLFERPSSLSSKLAISAALLESPMSFDIRELLKLVSLLPIRDDREFAGDMAKIESYLNDMQKAFGFHAVVLPQGRELALTNSQNQRYILTRDMLYRLLNSMARRFA